MTDPPAGVSPIDDLEPGQIEASLTLDTVLELLANRRRRFALYTLAEAPGGVVGLEELFDEVATLTAALDGAAVTREGYQAVVTDLYHWHLPVLADVGIIACDARHRTVRYNRDPALETWLRRVRRDELP